MTKKSYREVKKERHREALFSGRGTSWGDLSAVHACMHAVGLYS